MKNFKEKADLIWRVADLLRGDYKQSDTKTALNNRLSQMEKIVNKKCNKKLDNIFWICNFGL